MKYPVSITQKYVHINIKSYCMIFFNKYLISILHDDSLIHMYNTLSTTA